MKRILSILTAFTVVILTAAVPAVTAAQPASSPLFEEASWLMDTVGALSADKCMEYRQDMINRDEFAYLAGHLVGLNQFAAAGESYYYDIPHTHWASSQINTLAKLGVLTPGEDKLFRPDVPITASEAAKIVTLLLGYGYHAQTMGGYPVGHMAQAQQLGLLSGINAGSAMTYADALVMLYHAFQTDIVDSMMYDNVAEYTPREGETMLERNYGITILEGQLTGCPGVFFRDVYTQEGKIILEGEVYPYSGGNAEQFLGSRVLAWCRDYDTSPQVIHLSYFDANPAVVTLPADDSYIGYQADKNAVGVYNDRGRVTNYPIATDVQVLVNLENVFTPLEQAFAVDNGFVRLIDSDYDGSYDIAMIESYINYVVGYADSINGTIVDKYDTAKRVTISPDQVRYCKLYAADGEEISFSAIGADDVVSVYQAADTIRAYRSNSIITGVAEQYSATDREVAIDGTLYPLDSGFSGVTDIAVGNRYTLRMDYQGNIVAADAGTNGGMTYGYLADYQTHNNGVDKALVLKIYTQNGTMEAITLADNVKIDGETCREDADKAIACLALADANVAGQLIRYQCDEEGRLTRIDTTYQQAGNQTDTFHMTANGKSDQYYYYSNQFGQTDLMNGNTVIVKVPISLDNYDEDMDFAIYSGSGASGVFTNKGNGGPKYTVSCYKTLQETGYIDAAVYYTADATTEAFSEYTDELYLVEDVVDTVNTDGEPVKGVRCASSSGKTTKYYEKEGAINVANVIGAISGGDIVRIKYNGKNEIVNMVQVYDYSENQILYPAADANSYVPASYDKTFNVHYGYPVSCKNGVVEMAYTPTDTAEFAGSATVPVVVYDTAGRTPTIRMGGVGDIPDYNSTGQFSTRPIFIRSKWAQFQWMIVYR